MLILASLIQWGSLLLIAVMLVRLGHRWMAVQERWVRAQTRRERPIPLPALPADLMGAAMEESEKWAQEDVRAYYYSLAQKTGGDWDKVRDILAQTGGRVN